MSIPVAGFLLRMIRPGMNTATIPITTTARMEAIVIIIIVVASLGSWLPAKKKVPF